MVSDVKTLIVQCQVPFEDQFVAKFLMQKTLLSLQKRGPHLSLDYAISACFHLHFFRDSVRPSMHLSTYGGSVTTTHLSWPYTTELSSLIAHKGPARSRTLVWWAGADAVH